jgi:hypothetical protein
MSIGRSYKVGVFDTSTWLPTGAAVAGVTTPVPILYGLTASTSDLNITNMRMGVMGASAFPSNADAFFSINQLSGTKAGGNPATPVQLSGVTKATLATWSTAGGTSAAAITGTTAIAPEYWGQVLPFTAGASWEDWVTPGFEVNIPVSTGFAVYVTCSSAGTGTTFWCELEYTE